MLNIVRKLKHINVCPFNGKDYDLNYIHIYIYDSCINIVQYCINFNKGFVKPGCLGHET